MEETCGFSQKGNRGSGKEGLGWIPWYGVGETSLIERMYDGGGGGGGKSL